MRVSWKPSLTGILNRMIEQKLVQKRKDYDDQRISLISLTESGFECFKMQAVKMEASYKKKSKNSMVKKKWNNF